MTIEDGIFYACSGTVKNKLTARKTISSTVLGKEGFFNLSLVGEGVAALESNVPYEELIEVELDNDELKIDGNLAVCWSSGLEFTVEIDENACGFGSQRRRTRQCVPRNRKSAHEPGRTDGVTL